MLVGVLGLLLITDFEWYFVQYLVNLIYACVRYFSFIH